MKKTVEYIRSMKGREKIGMLTAYDYSTAKYMDETGIDIILVGDSLGMVVLGYENTLDVTVEDMLRHTGAVARGTTNALIVTDLPAGSYDDVESAAANAEALVRSGADAVKLENSPHIAEYLVYLDIPVQGHVGLTPQSVADFKVQGREAAAAQTIIQMAKDMETAGCYSVILEALPQDLGELITETLTVPTIGIGAGPHCDGQVLVVNDMLGLYDKMSPRFVKKYASLADDMKGAFQAYVDEVKSGKFPEEKHSFR